MEQDFKLSIFIGKDDNTRIEVKDVLSTITFLRLELTNDQLASVLSRLANVSVKGEINDLDKIGKQMENKKFEFALPEEFEKYSDTDKLRTIAQGLLDKEDEGWIADSYFGSKDSFFNKDGVEYARVIIRRWI